MKRFLAFFLVFSLFIIVVNAQQSTPGSDGTLYVSVIGEPAYKVGTAVNVQAAVFNSSKQQLTNSGVECWLSVYQQNSSDVFINNKMDYANGFFNFTVTDNVTYQIGMHNYLVACNTTQNGGYSAGSFEVSLGGFPGKEDNVPLLAGLVLFGVALIWLFLIFSLSGENFTEHGLVKVAVIVLVLWVLMLPVSLAVDAINTKGGSAAMLGTVETLFIVMIYLNAAFTLYMIVFMIVSFARSLNNNAESGSE